MPNLVAGLALALLLAAATPAAAQLAHGRVVDKHSGAGVATVTVQMLDTADAIHRVAVTDTTGWFRLRAAAAGTYRVRAQMIGYAGVTSEPLTLDQAAQTELEIVLDREAIVLEPVRVVAERSLMQGPLAEYFNRAEWVRRSGMGRVYMRADLEGLGSRTLTHLIAMTPRRANCPMTYFIDGLPWDRSYVEGLSAETVEGVEVYRSRQEVPPEYQRLTRCGATLVWTRRDLTGRRMTWQRLAVSVGGIAGAFLLFRTLLGGR